MNAIVLSIGDELVLGQTVDTNSAWLSNELASIGWSVLAHVTVGDSLTEISGAIAAASTRGDALVVTGGLGPTKDDLTRDALAQVLGVPLEMNADWLSRMEAMFRLRKRTMSESNRIQAMIPRGAKMIENTAGTAAGIDATLGSCRIFVMPGVPAEMRTMFQRSVIPHLSAKSQDGVILTRTLHTFGQGESVVGEMLRNLMDRSRNPTVGTTVSEGVVSVRIVSRANTQREAEENLAHTIAQCVAVLGDLIYGAQDQTLPSVLAELLTKDQIRTVATAESCTGGLLAKMLTDIPGSSRYFQRGWITYSNEAKTDLLGVEPQIIERHGAVSEEVVRAMSISARKKASADFALAISGVAGPDGGTPAKPVGMVCIGFAHADGVLARTFSFPGNRQMVRDRAAKMALTILRYHLLARQMPF
jgi:nicotinamide-nucleotide amidase